MLHVSRLSSAVTAVTAMMAVTAVMAVTAMMAVKAMMAVTEVGTDQSGAAA